jgi:hypothetical protein
MKHLIKYRIFETLRSELNTDEVENWINTSLMSLMVDDWGYNINFSWIGNRVKVYFDSDDPDFDWYDQPTFDELKIHNEELTNDFMDKLNSLENYISSYYNIELIKEDFFFTFIITFSDFK